MESNKSAILRVAEKLFAIKGFDATTLRDIAQKSKANGALVSYYFGGKEALREEIFARKMAVLVEKIDAYIQAKDLIDKNDLSYVLKTIFLEIQEEEFFYRLAYRGLAEKSSFQKTILQGFWSPLLTKLTVLIMKLSTLKEEQAKVRASVLLSGIQYYVLLNYFQKGELGLKTTGGMEEFEQYITGTLSETLCR
jgi:AcrR family transcriptional regulator